MIVLYLIVLSCEKARELEDEMNKSLKMKKERSEIKWQDDTQKKE